MRTLTILSRNEQQTILYQIGRHTVRPAWTKSKRTGQRYHFYEVYRDSDSGTHAVKVATFGSPGPEWLERAKKDADRREALEVKA